jgi:hypothetical protein
LKCGKHTAEEFAAKVKAIVHEEGLLRAMADVGYFPTDTPPPVTLADH